MGCARTVLLAAAVAVAIAAEARADLALAALTLSPDADSLITTRGNSPTTSTASNTQTHAPVTEAPFTSAPATTAPATTAPPSSYSYSTSNKQETIDIPSTATVAPSSKAAQSETQTAASSTSESTNVDQLNDKNGGISSGNSTNGMLSTAVPAVLGALACVGAIVMAVTYKRKSSNSSDEDGARPNSDCEYTGDIDFTPENRKLTSVPENSPTAGAKASIQHSQTASASNSSVRSTSPFASSGCKARVSSPTHNSNSEANMEFQDSVVRHEGGSNVVLTFDEQTVSHGAPQVQL